MRERKKDEKENENKVEIGRKKERGREETRKRMGPKATNGQQLGLVTARFPTMGNYMEFLLVVQEHLKYDY